MRNLLIVTAAVFIAILVTSYFYFSNLAQHEQSKQDAHETPEGESTPLTTAAEAGPSLAPNLTWAFDLNAQPTIEPAVFSYDDTSKFVMVQDAYHILYAISITGDKLWNAQLPGAIVGRIQQLDDHSLIFATAERLYRIDTEGDPLPGFSLRLPHRATERVTGYHENDGSLLIEVQATNRTLVYDGRGRHLRSRSGEKNRADKYAEQHHGRQPTSIDTLLRNIPTDCGPLFYYGPLQDGGGDFLICNEGGRTLYCYSIAE
ncbi:hypothetical protein ACFOET_04455 [Parapedobacter deserti]|uniref:PQQ-like domain-containing protein n=1 Tax=Parapedobacter deserti TaxID=1912957 RepID=A0ABV7JJ35_9SPHI